MFAFADLKAQCEGYLRTEDLVDITRAYEVAKEAHRTQVRSSGEPYITHPLEVAKILAQMQLDKECICAALLHDTIEDTEVTKQSIEIQFGEKIAQLVDGVSKLKQIRYKTRQYQQAANFRKMMLAMAQDIRVILIKLADRLHNMRTLTGLPVEKKRRVALETLEIYAPIAHRLGINTMRIEFEELGFEHYYPYRYSVLKEEVKKLRRKQKKLIEIIQHHFDACFAQIGFKHYKLWGREKHLYSIYRKMREKNIRFSNIMDFYAFRIIVADEYECYKILGLVHRCYPPMSGRFKDYIAAPKPNGYRALHTTLIGPQGVPIEVQIRDKDMDSIAENGIAAHWLYKNKLLFKKSPESPDAPSWLSSLMDIQKKTGSPLEFIKEVKTDLHPEALYVYTPKGRIIALPKGATAVDFAYAVHTDIGNRCIGCKINRLIASLSTPLENGQSIEIITTENAHPNPAWLNFTVTGKARSNIRHWVKDQQRTQSQTLGRRLINGVLAAKNISLDNYSATVSQKIAERFEAKDMDDLFELVGLGKGHVQEVANAFFAEKTIDQPSSSDQEPLVLNGLEGLVISYANCCSPIPGDLILGMLSSGKGITVHRQACEKVQTSRYPKESFIPVQWDKELHGEFQVPVVVVVANGRGVLADLATTISSSGANINNVKVDPHDGIHNSVTFYITVRNRGHLARVMRRLRALTGVIKVSRS